MNQFEFAIQDIFNVPEFVEYMQYGEQQIKVIAFSIDENGQYTQFGFDPNISFYLTCKKAARKKPANHVPKHRIQDRQLAI